jgi:integrase
MLKTGEFSMMEIAQIVGHSNTEMIVRNYAKFIKKLMSN